MLQDPNSLMGLLTQYLRAVGWSITAAVGFAFGIGIALKVFDMLCENDQFVFEVLSIRDQNSIEFYNSALFNICCNPLVFDKNTQLIYGSLTMFDPPHINIDKPLQLDFYGGSSNIDLSILPLTISLNIFFNQIIALSTLF